MSKLIMLAAAAVVLAAPAAPAQVRQAGGAVTVSPVRGGVTAVPGRPVVVDRKPIRPGDGGDDSHLRRRLHNACFNDPTPPVPLCRRVFGDHEGPGTRTGG